MSHLEILAFYIDFTLLNSEQNGDDLLRCKNEEFVSGSVFHLYNHAIDAYQLFYDDRDYDFFILSLNIQLEKIPCSVFAYCLMPNHFHLLIRQDSDKKLYKALNTAFISYAKYFNKKYDRKGPIFRSPLQHIKVNNKTYLIQLCKYIHLNPVYADLVNEPHEWFYSNYLEWINKRESKLFTKEVFDLCSLNPEKYIMLVKS